MKTRVKVCCIKSVEEARLAESFGAAAIGLVSKMPSGPGVIDDDQIAEIMKHTGNSIDTFLLTSFVTAKDIIEQHNKFKTTTIQLVDNLPDEEFMQLRAALPETSLVQVVHVIDDDSIQYAINKSQIADALLLDSGNPNLEVKELGGTGKVHNWQISKQIVDRVDVPVILAGGLNDGNVAEAILTVNPYAVDLCSGVRTNGNLDEVKLKKFFEEVNKTDSQS